MSDIKLIKEEILTIVNNGHPPARYLMDYDDHLDSSIKNCFDAKSKETALGILALCANHYYWGNVQEVSRADVKKILDKYTS